MDFPDYNFEAMNETDVREEIIAPLLRYLGYISGTENDVIREQHLSYPKSSLGRKKKTDPILRGKADYICTAQNRIRWVIEAKSPSSSLDLNTVEQAWTYANHPEIRAVYLCITNGRKFKIYRTIESPESDPLFECEYKTLKSKLDLISSILKPMALLQLIPAQEPDFGKPIGPGLRSIVRIASGHFNYTENSLGAKFLDGLTMTITQGSIERNENDKLQAHIETLVPFQSLQVTNEKFGLTSMMLESNATALSTDSKHPTTFSSSKDIVTPKGTKVLNLETWQEVILPITTEVNVTTQISGFLSDTLFSGKFVANLTYTVPPMGVVIAGQCQVNLA